MSLNFIQINGADIFRPNINRELALRQEIESSFHNRFGEGQFVQRDEINSILQCLFSLYDERLKNLLQRCASFTSMQFVLSQYDLSCILDAAYKSNKMSPHDIQVWQNIGPSFRPAIKYLAECICMQEPPEHPDCSDDDFISMLNDSLICAESLFHYSLLSSQTFSIFPDSTTLTILPENQSTPYTEFLILAVDCFDDVSNYQQRGTIALQDRRRYDDLFQLPNAGRMAQYLDGPFKDAFGCSFSQMYQFVSDVIDGVQVPEGSPPMPFFREELFVSNAQEVLEITNEQAKVILEGLILTPSNMKNQSDENGRNRGRFIWKTNQEYRAYARPFFSFPDKTGPHLIWSPRMAKECLVAGLYLGVTHAKFPSEWKTPEINSAIQSCSQAITAEFEKITIRELRNLGIKADRFANTVGSLQIPESVGEIDCLAFAPLEQILFVIDCKYLSPGRGLSAIRNEMSSFLNQNHSYHDQILRKANWVKDNIAAVTIAIKEVFDLDDDICIERILPTIVTYTPAFSSYLLNDINCVAITELLNSVQRRELADYREI